MGYKNKEQQNEYQKQWKEKRRQEWLIANGPCKNCGSWDELEIDHINPEEKEFQATSLWSRKQEIRDKELAKCQVLCEDCHKDKTSKWYEDIRNHGYLMYNHWKCRCEICKSANAERSRWQRSLK